MRDKTTHTATKTDIMTTGTTIGTTTQHGMKDKTTHTATKTDIMRDRTTISDSITFVVPARDMTNSKSLHTIIHNITLVITLSTSSPERNSVNAA